MSTRTLLKRLERLQVKTARDYKPFVMVVDFVGAEGVRCKLRLGPAGQSQYLSADDKPISDEQATLLCSDSRGVNYEGT